MKDSPYQATVVAEARGEATEEEIRILESDLKRWRTTLVNLVEDADTRLGLIEADLMQEMIGQTAARAQVLEAEAAMRKVKTMTFKRGIERRLRYVNDRITADNREVAASHDLMRDLVDELLRLIDLKDIHDDIPPHLHGVLNDRLDYLSSLELAAA